MTLSPVGLAPPRVANAETYWSTEPPERSRRCAWWVKRIQDGWRPGRFIRRLGYYCSAEYYGVYIWEWLNVLAPLLERETKGGLT